MQRTVEKPNKNRDAKSGRKQDGFQKLLQTNEGALLYIVYADFECVLRKINTCEQDNNQSFTFKTEKHEPCGFSFLVVRSGGQTFGLFTYKGEDAVFVFFTFLQNHEREMREDMASKSQLVMANEDWQKHKNATKCHICNKSLVKDLYCDSMAVYDRD